MAEMSSGQALRQLQQAQAGLRKARQALRMARSIEGADAAHEVLRVGWAGLAQAHRLLGTIPLAAANEPVMTKQLAVQRYATSLLVRLRRVARNEPGALEGLDDEDAEDVE